MHRLQTHAAIHHQAHHHPDPNLRKLIAQRIEELTPYADTDTDTTLADLLHILILEPSDTLTSVDAELGFSLEERPIDVIESHPGWYELTVVLADDGFGVALYVPKHPGTDPKLLAICRGHPSPADQEPMP